MTTPIVDAHAHFWDPLRLHYPWLKMAPQLQQTFGLREYQQASASLPIEKLVFVECNCQPEQSPDEVAWVTQMAGMDPRIQGIVAYADLTNTQRIDTVLANYRQHPLIRGIRHNIQWNPKGFALQPAFAAGIHKVQQAGFHFELCCTYDQLDEVLKLVQLCEGVPLVLDHCGKPPINKGEIEPWQTQLRRLAAYQNVYCKISGLLTEADLQHWNNAQLKTYAEHAADCFGPQRIMFGSDWPVLTLAGRYQDWYDFTQYLTQGWNESNRRAFYHDNAVRFYRL